MSNPLIEYINLHKQDAVTYKTIALLKDTENDPVKRSLAVDELRYMLANVKDEFLSELYTKTVAGYAGVKAATLTKGIKEVKEKAKEKDDEQYVGEGKKALPKWVNKDRAYTIGFDWRLDETHPENTGIYFKQFSNEMERRTNFVMKPIVHIISQNSDDNRRITEMNNGFGKDVFELPSKAFVSVDAFESILLDQGHYSLDGLGKGDLNKIKNYFLYQYPRGYELKNLGWQKEGFFAFSNLIYHNGIQKFDEYGLAEVGGIKYLSMGSSNILKNQRDGTDIYENDKYLFFNESPITFSRWSELMSLTYGERYMMGISWVLLAINRDIVVSRSSYCPIPYCYGAAQSGKSQFAASLYSLFFSGLKVFNLNGGTEFAFWDYMSRFTNVLMPFNEFDEKSVDEKRVKAFKAVADDEGRAKGSGMKGKSVMQLPTCLPMLMGQYLSTMDDSAVLSRTTPEKFVEDNNRPQYMIDAFNELKSIEKKGISSLLIPMLENRAHVAGNYLETYYGVNRDLKAYFAKEGYTPKNRVVENYTTVLAIVKLYQGKLDLTFTYEEFFQYCVKQIMNLNNLIGESNSLGEFWSTVELLLDSGDIEQGWDFKVETHTVVNSLIGEKGSTTSLTLEKPTRLLFLCLKSVYAVFSIHKRQSTGKVAINETTIKGYLQEQPYYVGASKNSNFISKKQNSKKGTSSMVLNYDMLLANGINLDRAEINEDVRTEVTLEGLVTGKDAGIESIFGVEKVVFNLYQDESYINEQKFTVKRDVYTKCFVLETEMMWALKIGAKVKLTGLLAVVKKVDRTFRTMEVHKVELLEKVPGSAPPSPAQRFIPTPVQTELKIEPPTGDEPEAKF